MPNGGSVFQQNVAGAFESFDKIERLVCAFLISQFSVEFDKERFVDVSLCDEWLLRIRKRQQCELLRSRSPRTFGDEFANDFNRLIPR